MDNAWASLGATWPLDHLAPLGSCMDNTWELLGTTWRQLEDNLGTTLRQLEVNLGTTVKQLLDNLGQHFPLGCLNVYKICLRIWFGHLRGHYLYPQNSKTLSKKFWLIEILLISAFTKSWSERDSGAEKSGSGLGGGEQCEHVPVRTGSAARGSEGAAAPYNSKKSRVGARITESTRWNTKPPSAANSPSFKAWLFRIHIRPSKIEVLYHLWLLNYQSPH